MLQLVEIAALLVHQIPNNTTQACTEIKPQDRIDFPSRVHEQTQLLLLREVVFSPPLACGLLSLPD